MRFAAPGDEFVVGVSVANNLKGSGKDAKVKLAVAPSEHLEIMQGQDNNLIVPEGGETRAQIRVKAKDVLGGAAGVHDFLLPPQNFVDVLGFGALAAPQINPKDNGVARWGIV